MIEYHRSKKADVTVAMMVVPKSEIHQFGAGIVDRNDRVIDWEEKPKEAKTNLASMGIYVFDYAGICSTHSPATGKRTISASISCPTPLSTITPSPTPSTGTGAMSGQFRHTGRPIWTSSRKTVEFLHKNGKSEPISRLTDGRPTGHRHVLAALSLAELHDFRRKHIQGTVINSVLAPGVVVEEGAVVKDSILCSRTVSSRRGRRRPGNFG